MPEPRLAYCTNVARTATLEALEGSLTDLWHDVRERSGADRLGLGLWFPRSIAEQLATDKPAMRRLKAGVEAAGHTQLSGAASTRAAPCPWLASPT